MTENEMKAAGLGALTYQASGLEAYTSLGLVTAVGPSHDRSGDTVYVQHYDVPSVLMSKHHVDSYGYGAPGRATCKWMPLCTLCGFSCCCFTASSQQQFSYTLLVAPLGQILCVSAAAYDLMLALHKEMPAFFHAFLQHMCMASLSEQHSPCGLLDIA